jgi:hypothetical protein
MNSDFSYSYLNKYNLRCPPGYHYHPGNPKSLSNGCMKNSDMKGLEENFFSEIDIVMINKNKKFKKAQYCPAGYHYEPSNPLSDRDGCLKDVDTRCSISNLNINHNYGKDQFGGAFSLMGALKYPMRYDNENINYEGVS